MDKWRYKLVSNGVKDVKDNIIVCNFVTKKYWTGREYITKYIPDRVAGIYGRRSGILEKIKEILKGDYHVHGM